MKAALPRQIALAASTVALSASGVLAEQFTFTSGPPPIGDGTVYPRSINPARQVIGGGAEPDTFFANGPMGFVNVNGNPAYFDANNLLTRPSTLINGEAFWTDPKLGNFTYGGNPFSIAAMGFNLSPLDDGDFGFDLAVASVSNPVAPYIPFQVQDDSSNVAHGYVYFQDTGNLGSGDILADLGGNFYTLGSPHYGWEGRFSISNAYLKQMLADQNPSQSIGEVLFWDFRLESIATNGGTTQFAIDNVHTGNSGPPDPQAEPHYLPPIFVGANTPQYIAYAEPAPENYPGQTHQIDLGSDLSGTPVTVGMPSINAAEQMGASAYAAGSSITFSAGPDSDITAHETAHVRQEGANATVGANQKPLSDTKLGVGNIVQVAPIETNSLFGTFSSDPSHHGTSIHQQLLEMSTVLAVNSSDPMLATAFTFAADQTLNPTQFIVANDGSDPEITRFALVKDLTQTFEDYLAGVTPTGTLPIDDVTGSSYYFNYSLQEYIALKDSLGEAWLFGDSGSIVRSVFAEDGALRSYEVSTWLVTNQSGLFVPVFVEVPEPSGALLGLALPLILGQRGRRKDK